MSLRSKTEHDFRLSTHLMEICSEPDLPFFIAHLSLYSGDGMTLLDERRGSGAFPPDRLLYGNIVSSPHSLRNLHGSPGIYFLFPDVSVRYRGLYTLRISLMRLSRYATFPFDERMSFLPLAHSAWTQAAWSRSVKVARS